MRAAEQNPPLAFFLIMHILLLPSWYSTIDKPWRGTFFGDQARSLTRHGLRAGIAFVERRSLSRLTPFALRDSHFQVVSHDEHGVPTMRRKGWSTFAQTTAGALLWVGLTRKLVGAYSARYGIPDLIHGHGAMWGGYAAMLAARDLGRPYVITEHASSILTLDITHDIRRRLSMAYRNAARVIAVSNALKASVECIAGRPIAEVVPNTVDSRFFTLPPAPRPREPFVFLAAGDLLPSKRIDLLIRAFARLHEQAPHTRLVVAGDGKERSRLRDLASVHGVHDTISFTGALTRVEMRQQMWEANALVMPSDFETFGVVLIEAMSTGLPVIATRCGGPEEIVAAESGRLVDCGNETALVNAMSDFLVRSFDAMWIRERVSRRFGYEPVAARLCSIYDSVIARRREVA